MKITRDRSYLIDRLLKYEPVDDSCESADEDEEIATKKIKQEGGSSSSSAFWTTPKNNSEVIITSGIQTSQDDQLELVEKHLLARNETRIPTSFSFPRNIFDETDEV